MNKALTRGLTMLAAMALTASCTHREQHVATPPPPVLALPEMPARPGVLQINRDIGPGEMLWHLRAALNVAALACTAPAYAGVTPQYNAMLKRHEAALAAAYGEEEARYRQQYGASWQGAFDRHQTALYNIFADPRATEALCGHALTIMTQINALQPSQLSTFAGQALADLEAPVAIVKGGAVTAFNPLSAPPQP